MKEIIKGFRAYLRDYRLMWYLFLAEMIVLGAVIILSDIPTEISGYLLMLHLFLGAMFHLPVFLSYYKQYQTLSALAEKEEVLDVDVILPAKHQPELTKLYHDALEVQAERILKQEGKYQQKQREYQEYFTLWVHQVKTPIFAIELLVRNLEDRTQQAQINAELLKIKEYTQNVLQYVRLDNLSSDIDLKEYDLEEIVKTQLKKYALLFINQKIKLELTEFHFRIITDEKWLSFVVGQILLNALKYTQTGGTIQIFFQDRKLYIRDNGLGIRSEDIPKLFQKGFTGRNGRLQKEASGMGLYMSSKIMKSLGNEISLESELGKGTTVIFTFGNQDIQDY